MVKNSREFSLLDLDPEAFWFHFSLLEKEWKHFDFTLHFNSLNIINSVNHVNSVNSFNSVSSL